MRVRIVSVRLRASHTLDHMAAAEGIIMKTHELHIIPSPNKRQAKDNSKSLSSIPDWPEVRLP